MPRVSCLSYSQGDLLCIFTNQFPRNSDGHPLTFKHEVYPVDIQTSGAEPERTTYTDDRIMISVFSQQCRRRRRRRMMNMMMLQQPHQFLQPTTTTTTTTKRRRQDARSAGTTRAASSVSLSRDFSCAASLSSGSSLIIPRGIHRQALPAAWQPGTVVHGFEILFREVIPEYQFDAIQFRHVRTGAEYLHIDHESTDNVFSVNFRTPPHAKDSSGVAHILEHTVLCGSQKYPVRDPFFSMMKRSLNTYMNASTSAHVTSYPFSTTNAQDFVNLRDVYLDAVFFPLLRRVDFHQEGHRVAFSSDSSNSLLRKGVVYNEMKGVFQDPSNVLHIRLQQLLHPDSTYAAVSGGDPVKIPECTYEHLREFHSRHYRASNCLFYSFGDLSPEASLEMLDTQILSRFGRHEGRHDDSISVTSSSDVEQNPSSARAPIMHIIPCAADASGDSPDSDSDSSAKKNNNIRVCHAQLVGDSRNLHETFQMSILSYLLTAGPTSPMYQSLLVKAKLGSDFCAGTGLDASTLRYSFGVGIEGLSSLDQVEEFQHVRKGTLDHVIEHGFDLERIDSVLYQLTLSQNHQPRRFGLSLASGLVKQWTFATAAAIAIGTTTSSSSSDRRDTSTTTTTTTNLIDGLRVNDVMTELRAQLALDPHYFSNSLLPQKLVKNQERQVTLAVVPEAGFVEKQALEEARALSIFQSTCSGADVELIREQERELENHQALAQDNLECLPSLSLRDIPPDLPDPVIVHRQQQSSSSFIRLPTNGVMYFSAVLPLHDLVSSRISDNPWFPFFLQAWTSLGTLDQSYEDLALDLERCCAGFDLSGSSPSPNDQVLCQPSCPEIQLSARCLFSGSSASSPRSSDHHHHVQNLLTFVVKRLTTTDFDFDAQRLSLLLTQYLREVEQSMVHSAHHYARSYASASAAAMFQQQQQQQRSTLVKTAAMQQEEWSGITQYRRLLRDLSRLKTTTTTTTGSGSDDPKDTCDQLTTKDTAYFREELFPSFIQSIAASILSNPQPQPSSSSSSSNHHQHHHHHHGLRTLSVVDNEKGENENNENLVQDPATELHELLHEHLFQPLSERAQDIVCLRSDHQYPSSSSDPEKEEFETTIPMPIEQTTWTRQTYIESPGANVYAVAQCFATGVGLTHVDFVPLLVLCQILSSEFLHPLVREQGGAYGCVASHSSSGILSFVSYSDPHARETLEAYAQTLVRASSSSSGIQDHDVTQAVLSIFGDLDAPSSPSERGQLELQRDLGNDFRQARRAQLLNVTRDDVVRVARQYLVQARACSCIIGPTLSHNSSSSYFRHSAEWDIQSLLSV